MKCRYCGQIIDDKADFCTNCGMKIPREYVAVEPGARPPGASRRRGVSDWLKGSVAGGLIGILLIIVGILMVVSSFISIFDSAVDAADEPTDIVHGILGGFGKIIVGAILIAIGGTLIFFSFIGFIIGAIDSR